MPTISVFFGISIRMYFGDHQPPHFHAYYQGHSAVFTLDTLEITSGVLSRRARNLVVEWAIDHRVELMDNWQRIETGGELLPIEPLE